ncbi:hypothetical protein [Patulibacter minatonensis]|uniref:hypothetical protein n=1 Tax=Patulibacter minatonensis TaxID=298163 RepID=UPI0004B2D2B1|nr:hypothetical protein [Patulibacter minatonensis]
MLIVLVLLAAWLVVNVTLLGAVAVANQRGQKAVDRAAVEAVHEPVFAAAR